MVVYQTSTMKKLLTLIALILCVQTFAVPFTLRNNSAKSIPLIIPGVMNPNLSPMSNSGVDLKVGQEILFKYKGKKTLLLTVTEDLRDTKLNVSKLISERKKELDELKKANKKSTK